MLCKDSSGNIVNVSATFEQLPEANKVAKPVSYDEEGVKTGTEDGEKLLPLCAFKAKQDANIKEYGILYLKTTELNQVTAENYKQVKK